MKSARWSEVVWSNRLLDRATGGSHGEGWTCAEGSGFQYLPSLALEDLKRIAAFGLLHFED